MRLRLRHTARARSRLASAATCAKEREDGARETGHLTLSSAFTFPEAARATSTFFATSHVCNGEARTGRDRTAEGSQPPPPTGRGARGERPWGGTRRRLGALNWDWDSGRKEGKGEVDGFAGP